MSVHQSIESLQVNPGAAIRPLLAAVALRFAALQRIAVCVVFGHEKWTSVAGEWRCMRCSRCGDRPVPVSTDRGVRRIRDHADEARVRRAA